MLQDKLSATTVFPTEGETQYVGSTYINGGNYEIKLTKTEETDGSVIVNFTRETYMDNGGKRYFGASDTWVWDPKKKCPEKDKGILFLAAQYQSDEVGLHTWSTRIYWDGWEFTGVGWRYIGGGSAVDTNNFKIEETSGCS